MSVLNDFNSWKGFLSGLLQQAESDGMSEQPLNGIAYEVGDYLANSVEPENSEQAVLKELWTASQEERQAIASTMMKLVQGKSE
ncbi:DUF3243 family protein [Virgibacillus ainsalahensis]